MAGRLITRLEDKEIDIMAMKMIRMDEKLAQQLYIQHKDKYFCPRLIRFTISGPVIVPGLPGAKSDRSNPQIIGEADPDSANPGTSAAISPATRRTI
jgi:nucleoside-diphosphate kinase